MRKLGVLTIFLAVILVGAVPAYRLINDLDLLTGDDPRTVAASERNRHLTISFVSGSFTLFQVRELVTGLTGYFQLPDGETLTGPMQVSRCNTTPAASPAALPRYPAGTDWVCIRAETDQGERRHVSFRIRANAFEEAWSFYEAELEKLPFSGGGSQKQDDFGFDSSQFRSNLDTGRRVSIRYLFEPGYHGPLVSILDTEAR